MLGGSDWDLNFPDGDNDLYDQDHDFYPYDIHDDYDDMNYPYDIHDAYDDMDDDVPDDPRDIELRVAARTGDVSRARRALNQGANIDSLARIRHVPGEYGVGSPALLIAIKQGHEQMVDILLQAGASTSATSHHGQTALMVAAEYNKHRLVVRLLEAKAFINEIHYHNGNSALHVAVTHRAYDAARVLLDFGANINISGGEKFPCTPLFKAVSVPNNAKIVRMLLDAGADVNAVGTHAATPLMEACDAPEFVGYVRDLLVKGADVNARDCLGHTAVFYAARTGNVVAFDMLCKAGADLTVVDRRRRTLLMVTIHQVPIDSIRMDQVCKIIKRVVNGGADVEAVDDQSNTALLSLCSQQYRFTSTKQRQHDKKKNQRDKVLSTLLDCGANINAVDRLGRTALMNAAARGQLSIIHQLL